MSKVSIHTISLKVIYLQYLKTEMNREALHHQPSFVLLLPPPLKMVTSTTPPPLYSALHIGLSVCLFCEWDISKS